MSRTKNPSFLKFVWKAVMVLEMSYFVVMLVDE